MDFTWVLRSSQGFPCHFPNDDGWNAVEMVDFQKVQIDRAARVKGEEQYKQDKYGTKRKRHADTK